ncbi:hypothetical protein [Arthrobacter psychrolactophilus]|uniref:hypothetical protein n=1 Tax=Arthrobacter psychrolactophilus TaxID=92442 RepID=UPI0011B85602|nr:hypothetical protein [Arthrobacter psychrolactophilus]
MLVLVLVLVLVPTVLSWSRRRCCSRWSCWCRLLSPALAAGPAPALVLDLVPAVLLPLWCWIWCRRFCPALALAAGSGANGPVLVAPALLLRCWCRLLCSGSAGANGPALTLTLALAVGPAPAGAGANGSAPVMPALLLWPLLPLALAAGCWCRRSCSR